MGILTEAPIIKGIEAVLDAVDGSKVTLYVRTRAYNGSIPVEVTVVMPNIAINTHPTVDFWTIDYAEARDIAYDAWGWEMP